MKQILLSIFSLMILFLVSCEKDADLQEPGILTVNFDNIAEVNGTQKQLTLSTVGSQGRRIKTA